MKTKRVRKVRKHSFVKSLTNGTPHHHWLAKTLIEGFVVIGAAGLGAYTVDAIRHRKIPTKA